MSEARFAAGPGHPSRHLVIRIEYSDDRAEEFLKRKAKQLPNDCPGLIMIDTSNVRGALRGWTATLKRRFQPSVNTRVGGVCMFHRGHELTAVGEEIVHRASLIANPHAAFAIPSWIVSSLDRFPEWSPAA